MLRCVLLCPNGLLYEISGILAGGIAGFLMVLCCFAHTTVWRCDVCVALFFFCRRPLPFGGPPLEAYPWTRGESNHHRQSVRVAKNDALPTEPRGHLMSVFLCSSFFFLPSNANWLSPGRCTRSVACRKEHRNRIGAQSPAIERAQKVNWQACT